MCAQMCAQMCAEMCAAAAGHRAFAYWAPECGSILGTPSLPPIHPSPNTEKGGGLQEKDAYTKHANTKHANTKDTKTPRRQAPRRQGRASAPDHRERSVAYRTLATSANRCPNHACPCCWYSETQAKTRSKTQARWGQDGGTRSAPLSFGRRDPFARHQLASNQPALLLVDMSACQVA